MPILGMTGPGNLLETVSSLVVLSLIVAGCIHGAKRTARRKEMEHAERMRALELGVALPSSGLDWPTATVCIAVGAGVPLGSFLTAWLACLTANLPAQIWIAPVFVSFAAIGASRKLAFRMIDPRQNARKNRFVNATASSPKPAFDPEAFEPVGHRV